MSVILDDDLRRDVTKAMEQSGEPLAAVLRKAIKTGLPLLKSGGSADVLTLDSEHSSFVDKLAEHYKRTRNFILLEAIYRGIRSVEAHLLANTPNPDVPPEVLEDVLRMEPGAQPLLREVWLAKRAKGRTEIELDDLYRHCPEALERKQLIEKVHALRRKKYGSIMHDAKRGNLRTETIKKEIESLEAEGFQVTEEDMLPAPPVEEKPYAPQAVKQVRSASFEITSAPVEPVRKKKTK